MSRYLLIDPRAARDAAMPATPPTAPVAIGGSGPSILEVITARTYNRAHRSFVEAFNAATGGSCKGADGEIDPVAVWHWQKHHGIRRDGRVGPETAAAARQEHAGPVSAVAGRAR